MALTGLALAAGGIALVLAGGLGGGSPAGYHSEEARPAARGGGSAARHPAARPRTATVSLAPVGDVSVFAAQPRTNHGGTRPLRVDRSPVVRSYLRFDLAHVAGRVLGASLSLDPLTEHPVGVDVRLAAGGWREHEITYATAPPPGRLVGRSGPTARSVRVSIDVTRFVRGRRELGLALVGTTSQQISLAGRRHGAGGPRLTVRLKARGRSARPARPHSSGGSAAPARPSGIPPRRRLGNPLVAAAGDIACHPSAPAYNDGAGTRDNCRAQAVSDMLLRLQPTAVLPLGDNQYECGDLSAYRRSYAASWGRLKAISHPVVGNHEYGEACGRSSARGHFRYFGAAAGPFGRGYYSYDLGRWHMIALNSQCSSGRGRLRVGGCETGSPQERWLRRDLAANRRRCTLAYWHEPRFSSGQHGAAQQMADIWNDLVRARADVVLSAHNHSYERFSPLGAVAGVDRVRGRPNFQHPVPRAGGIRQFVVGTGGKNHYEFAHRPLRGEVVRESEAYGALLLRLGPRGYSWRFLSEPGETFTDAGSGRCH